MIEIANTVQVASADNEGTWGDKDEPEAAAGSASGIPDLSRAVTVKTKKQEFEIQFDMANMTPRLRKEIDKMKDPDYTADQFVDFKVMLITKVLESWTLKDKQGNIVPLSDEAIMDVGYGELNAIYDAINGAALPNAAEGAN